MKKSAGLLMYRHSPAGEVQVLLAHPGGPFWRGRDESAWTLPKGEYLDPEGMRSRRPAGSSPRRPASK